MLPDSRIPFYIQVMDDLRQDIGVGVWLSGQRIPGEHELSETYGVSRAVVRQALRELEYEGLIFRRKGKGTFVATPKIAESIAQELTGFYQDMMERGHIPVTKVLHLHVTPASKKVAGYLAISPGATVIDLQRLRFVNQEPTVLVTSYLPHALCPGLEDVDFMNASLYSTLEDQYGLQIARGRRRIEAVNANEFEAELLQVDEGAALLMLDSISYLENGQPMEYYHALHRGDRSRFDVELVRIREQGSKRETIAPHPHDLPPSNALLDSKHYQA